MVRNFAALLALGAICCMADTDMHGLGEDEIDNAASKASGQGVAGREFGAGGHSTAEHGGAVHEATRETPVGEANLKDDLKGDADGMRGPSGEIVYGQAPRTQPVPQVPTQGVNKSDYVRIILDEDDNMPPTGQPFSLNGRAYIIRPGEKVNVPPGIIDILDNAVMTVPVVERGTGKVVGHREKLRFNYRRVA